MDFLYILLKGLGLYLIGAGILHIYIQSHNPHKKRKIIELSVGSAIIFSGILLLIL